jgi:hypothetical protein
MYRFSSTPRLLRSFTSKPSSHLARGLATLASQHTLQVLEAPSLSYAQHRDHVDRVSSQLERTGMLKISLGFPDDSSSYLKQLLVSLHKHHNHHLPISHSARQGWFWDVRPSKTMFQAGDHQVCMHPHIHTNNLHILTDTGSIGNNVGIPLAYRLFVRRSTATILCSASPSA